MKFLVKFPFLKLVWQSRFFFCLAFRPYLKEISISSYCIEGKAQKTYVKAVLIFDTTKKEEQKGQERLIFQCYAASNVCEFLREVRICTSYLR